MEGHVEQLTVEATNMLEVDQSEKVNESRTDINENLAMSIQMKLNTDENETRKNEEKSDYKKLEETMAYQEELLEKDTQNIKILEENCLKLEQTRQELESKLESAIKQKEQAVKEKEAMVIRYAVSEKNVIKERQQKEQADKKQKELLKENELLQHKLQTMISEKSRICQLFDNKCYEHKNTQQEMEKIKTDLSALETKLKWSQNSLKTEIEAHKESQSNAEILNTKLQEALQQIDQAKKDAEESIKNFHHSQENKAFVLDQQVKEQQALIILLRHERGDRDQQIKTLQHELQRLQIKQKEMLQENNDLSLRVQQLERQRLENEQKLSELQGCQDQQKHDFADLQSKNVQLEQLKLQLKHEQDQLSASNEQINLLKQRNQDLEASMEACRVREAELLLFTQQLTEKNVRLQSEFTAMETKVQQLTCEQTLLKRKIKEQESKVDVLSSKLNEERLKSTEKIETLQKALNEASIAAEQYKQEFQYQKGENVLMKRKHELSLRELNKEIQQCRKKLDQYENVENCSSASSNSSERITSSPDAEQVKVIQPDGGIDKQTLIEHIVKLQRISAKKSEKLDFLEEHVNTLVAELQKKTKLLQSYIIRDQTGALTSNSMDNHKAQLAKLNGVMASMYSSRVSDDHLTLELSLDINRKLQAVLEDALLKNITLKENVDTLGSEIDRLHKQLKT